MSKLLLYLQTLRYLKPIQIYYKFYYALKHRLFGLNYNISKNQNFQYPDRSNEIQFRSITSKSTYTPLYTFTFLNLTHSFQNGIDWNFNDYKKLWTYNLNYFDYLLQEDLSKDSGQKLIYQYIKDFDWVRDGKEPYPTSLRVINWIKFCLKHCINDNSIEIALHNQVIHLSKNLEYHLLANHLLENAFALTIGAIYLKDDKLFLKGSKLLIRELNEQILPDGAHYERSPMYHQIILFRLLDTINIITTCSVDPELKHILQRKAANMLGWIRQLAFTGNQLPLFKDSSNGIAPTIEDLLSYASQLNIIPNSIPLKESGYRKLITKDFEILVDVGGVSPSYQPGHAHADHLSYELYFKGQPVIVDTGTSTYNIGEIRSFERSTSSHNCVTAHGLNSSEIWASHRVGARATVKLISYKVNSFLKASLIFAKKNGLIHDREVIIEYDGFKIVDRVAQANKNRTVVSNIHLHPDRKFSLTKNGILIDLGIQVEFYGHTDINFHTFYYSPEFNKRIESTVISVIFTEKLETRFKAQ